MKTVILVILLLKSVFISAQFTAIATAANAGGHSYAISYGKHKGIIALKDGSKMQGIFQYAADEFPDYNVKMFSHESRKSRYTINEVQSLVLAGSDTTLYAKDSTYFFVMGKHKRFWRQVAFDKDIQVYDILFNINERIGLIYPMLLIQKNGELYLSKGSTDFLDWMRKNASEKIDWKRASTEKDIIRQLNGLCT